MSARSLILAVGVVLACLVVPAHAAIPYGGARYVVHDHKTKGKNWHVDARVSKDARRIKTLVIYAEHCGGDTAFAEGVEIGPVGDVKNWGPIDPERPSKGAYLIEARFADKQTFEGEFWFSKKECEVGPIKFKATTGADGHKGHDHGSHHSVGPAFGTMPDLSEATPRRLRQARRLWEGSKRSARDRFPTYRAARRQGYVRYSTKWKRPVIFHLRHHGYARDRNILDPDNPESLVYYWPVKGDPILVAFMYRGISGRKPPPFAKPLLAWHAHQSTEGGKGASQMSHIWLTGGLRSALANCLPVRQLEAAIPRFHYADLPTKGAAHESAPCP